MMSDLPGGAGLFSSLQLQSSTVASFAGPHQPVPFSSVSSQGPSRFHGNKAYRGSTSPEEYDTEMGGTMAGSSTAVSNATSPENGVNDDGNKDHGKGASMETKMAAIPEYFASKKTKDGKIPKKRGPKPDSKPARDRRQELNRQAQRNHRYRKEEQQKWLEEALAEAHDKSRIAMRRAQQAEELHTHMTRGNEQLLRENERLKQLLNVNKIPFEHVIPQSGSRSIDHPQQHRESVVNTNALQSAKENTHGTAPSTNTAATTPMTPSTALTSRLSPHSSSSADTTLNDIRLRSSMSPISPMDGTFEYNEQDGNLPTQGYAQSSSSHRPILQIGSTSGALTGQPSGPITGPVSAPAAVSANYGAQFGVPSFPQTVDQVLDRTYPASSVDVNQPYSGTSGRTLVENQHLDPFAIRDHDQIGVEFILALEANCHDHKTMMNARTFNDPVELGGHSLMLTKVPIDVAKNYRKGDSPYPHRLPDVGEGPGKYARLLSLVSLEPYSTNKNWASQSGEITPAQALGVIRKDPRYAMLNSKDFLHIANVLKDRCRCYGFGAVVEVYEVVDVLDEIFKQKGFGVENGFDLDNPFWNQVPLSNPHTLNGPEFPALDGLMDFKIAGLMNNRHADREQFLAADLSTFNLSPNMEVAPENHQCSSHGAAFVNSQSSQSANFFQIPTFNNVEPASVIQRVQSGQITSEFPEHYHGISSDYSTFNANTF